MSITTIQLSTAFDKTKLENEKEQLNNLLQQKETYEDIKLYAMYNKRLKQVTDKIIQLDDIKSAIFSINEVYEDICNDFNQDMVSLIEEELTRVGTSVNSLYVDTLLNGEMDKNNAIVKIHSGAGGTEACDWVSMLYRMYLMYANSHGFTLTETDRVEGDDAGIKSVSFMLDGYNAYGYLKSEIGVHRLVRISPFDSNKRRHTSFASVEVLPELDESININISNEDLKIDTYRSSGAGGQHVNTTDSAIRITHIPTGIVVNCQNERSQIKNKEIAMKMLKSKLYYIMLEQKKESIKELKGNCLKIEWGSQIRSYVFCPYTMVKDNRTGCETANVESVMNGEIDDFILSYLKLNSVSNK